MSLTRIRRWLGRSASDQALIETLWRQRDEARNQVEHERRRHRASATIWAIERRRLHAAEAAAYREAAKALEPARDGDCRKVRLRDRAEADVYARQVEANLGRATGELKSYPCKQCPRHPVSQSRFWHVANSDRRLRTGRPDADRQRRDRARDVRRSGLTVGQRVDLPERLFRLGEEAS